MKRETISDKLEVNVPLKNLIELEGVLSRSRDAMSRYLSEDLAPLITKTMRKQYDDSLKGTGNNGHKQEATSDEEFSAFYEAKGKGFGCTVCKTERARALRFSAPRIVEHLAVVHKIKPDDQTIDGWNAKRNKEYMKSEQYVKLEKPSKKPTKTKKESPSRRIPLMELQRLGVPELVKRRIRVDPCPRKCPRIADQRNCTPENCLNIGNKQVFREVYYVASGIKG